MKKKNMAVIGMVVGCLMMVAGAAWANGVQVLDKGNGTVTIGSLVWLKNASCYGDMDWNSAKTHASNLQSGACGLKDSSKAGEWRLPTVAELGYLQDYANKFEAVQLRYWSSDKSTDEKKCAEYFKDYVSGITKSGKICAMQYMVYNQFVFNRAYHTSIDESLFFVPVRNTKPTDK